MFSFRLSLICSYPHLIEVFVSQCCTQPKCRLTVRWTRFNLNWSSTGLCCPLQSAQTMLSCKHNFIAFLGKTENKLHCHVFIQRNSFNSQ